VALFFWRALTYRQPIVDLRAYLNRNFVFGSFFHLRFANPRLLANLHYVESTRSDPLIPGAAVCQNLSVAEAKQIEGF
jgi:hypothetical protein